MFRSILYLINAINVSSYECMVEDFPVIKNPGGFIMEFSSIAVKMNLKVTDRKPSAD